MKHLKRFENFYLPDEDEFNIKNNMEEVMPNDSDCETCDDSDEYLTVDDFEDDFKNEFDEDSFDEFEDDFEDESYDDEFGDEWGDELDAPDFDESGIDKFESKKSKPVSYKKSGLKRPDLADRNKNKKIEGWEMAIAKKIEKELEKNKKGSKNRKSK